ncbi:MAG TPA: site-2 protease family protein [Thermoleophilia bacterium]|nr:site-2 protease family protein [Thermoleophilia bacterium]
MGRGVRIARIFGIDVSIHPSWIIIFVLTAWTLADSYLPNMYAATPITTWIVAAVLSILLFVSVLVHELAHSLVAKAQGIPVRSITLFLLGGVSTIEHEASSPGREAVMAGAGPVSSLVLGLACTVLAWVTAGGTVVHAMVVYLAFINLLLAVFNLLPGFPLDGGRVLRSILWAITHDPVKATRWAARTGTVFGYLMIVAAVIWGFRLGDLIGALWTGFIGWFLVQASQTAYRQATTETGLRGVPVRRLMSQPTGWIPGDITLRRAANDYFIALNSRCLPVQDDYGHLEGLICVADLQQADERTWGVDQVQDVMTPLDRLQTVGPDDPASEAFHRLVVAGVNQLAVVQEGRLIGFVDRASVVRHLQIASHSGYLEPPTEGHAASDAPPPAPPTGVAPPGGQNSQPGDHGTPA